MRVLLVSAVLALTAACVMQPPPPEATAPPPAPGPVALIPAAPAPPPQPVAAMAAPVPVAPEAAQPADVGPVPQTPGVLHPTPVAYLSSLTLPAVRLMAPEQLRLTLSNYTFDMARVQVLTTPYPDCLAREGTTIGEFVLPLNGTRMLEVPPGIDVCWRRVDALPAGQQPPGPPATGFPWNRAYLTSGHSIDARL